MPFNPDKYDLEWGKYVRYFGVENELWKKIEKLEL